MNKVGQSLRSLTCIGNLSMHPYKQGSAKWGIKGAVGPGAECEGTPNV